MGVSKQELKNDLIPTVISDDGKRRVIRYSLRNGSNPPKKVETNPQKRTVEFVDHAGFKPVERVVRAENVHYVMPEKSRSTYLNQEPKERIVKTIIRGESREIQREPKVINVVKAEHAPLNTSHRGRVIND